ncbi:DUF1488 domain-containing protein (plasmid) [Cupriavidus pauculus]|uniref:DUF1488 domain-containing protein n=1 Tax=Cupriavidus pauculus TaxID=82633 RepID=A0A5P2H8J2_9BURK|nr:DUF1488 domain-containing protein [Cupriavidus pauculus]QET03944.1 DUF1488 domain-containing protein [Cupriavidus pauculus]
MALNFPNPSRSYDASRNCVRFWGYDESREVSFQVSGVFLAHLAKDLSLDEERQLALFDRYREQIYGMAHEIYTDDPRNTYVIG